MTGLPTPRTTTTGHRCHECGEDAVTLIKASTVQQGKIDVLRAGCEACGYDVKADIERLQEDDRE